MLSKQTAKIQTIAPYLSNKQITSTDNAIQQHSIPFWEHSKDQRIDLVLSSKCKAGREEARHFHQVVCHPLYQCELRRMFVETNQEAFLLPLQSQSSSHRIYQHGPLFHI